MAADVWGCSPLRRGWPLAVPRRQSSTGVLPAQAGVAPERGGAEPVDPRAPRSGGGGPSGQVGNQRLELCSPLRRGWPPAGSSPGCGVRVLPAQAGVAPRSTTTGSRRSGAPRSGGGGPIRDPLANIAAGCSPLRRGWPPAGPGDVPAGSVLPAQAGVAPSSPSGITGPVSAPRSGRGGPRRSRSRRAHSECSPLRRGWPLVLERLRSPVSVLPAQAGVAPGVRAAGGLTVSAPRSGGGGPWSSSG